MAVVYFYEDPVTLEVKYVGMGKKTRPYTHLKGTTNIGLKTLIAKHSNIQPIVFDGFEYNAAQLVEKFWIKIFGRTEYDEHGTLFNKTAGGQGFKNPSPSTRAKLSESLRNSEKLKKSLKKWHTSPEYEQYKERMRAIMTGRKMPQEALDRRSKAVTGRKLSESHIQSLKNAKRPNWSDEHRKKFSALMLGRKQEIVTCPHCGKQGGRQTMGRWHFNNCRSK